VAEGVDTLDVELVGGWMVDNGDVLATTMAEVRVMGISVASFCSVGTFFRCSLFLFQYSCNDTCE